MWERPFSRPPTQILPRLVAPDTLAPSQKKLSLISSESDLYLSQIFRHFFSLTTLLNVNLLENAEKHKNEGKINYRQRILSIKKLNPPLTFQSCFSELTASHTQFPTFSVLIMIIHFHTHTHTPHCCCLSKTTTCFIFLLRFFFHLRCSTFYIRTPKSVLIF